MEFQELSVTIDPSGQVRMEVRGMAGLGCLELTRALEAALGGDVLEREMKPEAYEAVSEHQELPEWGH